MIQRPSTWVMAQGMPGQQAQRRPTTRPVTNPLEGLMVRNMSRKTKVNVSALYLLIDVLTP